MTRHLGDYSAATVIYGKFTTVRPSTGAPYTLAGTPAISVYKDDSLTQSTTGVTLTVDFDGVTGFNHFTIDTSADGTFYSAGSNFDIVITTGTIDSVSAVGQVVGSFSIGKAAVLSRLPAALVSGRIDASVGAMATDVITSTAIAASAVTELQSGIATSAEIAALPTANENAAALLKYDMSTVTGEAARSPLNALRLLRNKHTPLAGVLTVYKEDDTTVVWTANISTDPNAEPITGITPT